MATASDGRRDYCIAASRCRLCQFRVEDGDLVAVGQLFAAGPLPRPSLVPTCNPSRDRFASPGPDPRDISNEFRFERGGWAKVSYKGFRIHMCCGRCGPYSAETAHCFHATCVKINRQVPSPRKFFAATRYLFETSPREDRQRELILQRLMVEALRRAFATSHLPVELWFRIARHLVREFAIITAQAQVRHHASAGVQIDLSRDVYASYAIFEGIRYLKTLRNTTEAEAERGEYLLMDARRGRAVQDIYIAFDHLGIRQVQFASPNRVLPGPAAIPGVWWRHLTSEGGISTVETETDVSTWAVPRSYVLTATAGHEAQRHISYPGGSQDPCRSQLASP